MQWSDFYDNYEEWSESTLESRISSLREMGPADEVVSAIISLPTEQLKVRLVQKAIQCGVVFSHENFLDLDGEFPIEVYRTLAAYAGFDADHPYINEKNLLWEDFYMEYDETWDEETLRRMISLLKDMGPGDEIEYVVSKARTDETKTQLIRKAMEFHSTFTHEDFKYLAEEIPTDLLRELADYTGFDADDPSVDENNLTWDDFYWACDPSWSEEVLCRRIPLLKDVGSGEDVAYLISSFPTEKTKLLLLHKAMEFQVRFTREDFEELAEHLPKKALKELADYANFDAEIPVSDEETPDFDEDNVTWDDFYDGHTDWPEKLLRQRIEKLTDIGATEEVCEVILNMPTIDCEEALYEKAKALGAKFTAEQLEEIGHVEIDVNGFLDDLATGLEENTEILCDELRQMGQQEQARQRRNTVSFWGLLFGVLGAFAGIGKGKRDSGRCDGDCANCPPHYGYRYGRWYYGHGHIRGCQRGGNRGA